MNSSRLRPADQSSTASPEPFVVPAWVPEYWEPVTDAVVANRVLTLLENQRHIVEHDVELLILRARARSMVAHHAFRADVRRAGRLACDDGRLSSWIAVHEAYCVAFFDGNPNDAKQLLLAVLESTPTLDHTVHAFALQVYGQVAAAVDDRPGLTLGERILRMALREWEATEDPVSLRRCRLLLVSAVLGPLGRHREAFELLDDVIADDDGSVDITRALNLRGFASFDLGEYKAALVDFTEAERRAHRPVALIEHVKHPAWGKSLVAARRDATATALREAHRASGMAARDGSMATPFLAALVSELAARRSTSPSPAQPDQLPVETKFGRLRTFTA